MTYLEKRGEGGSDPPDGAHTGLGRIRHAGQAPMNRHGLASWFPHAEATPSAAAAVITGRLDVYTARRTSLGFRLPDVIINDHDDAYGDHRKSVMREYDMQSSHEVADAVLT